MKIGVCVRFNDIEEMDNKFKNLRKEKFESCQLISRKPSIWTSENAELIKKLMNEYKIEVTAFWCGWEGPAVWNFYEGQKTLGLVPPEYRERRVKNLCDGADFAKKLGVCDIATHMGFIPENPYDVEFDPFCDAVRKVAEHLEKNGQYLLFETGQETPVTLMRCFEKVKKENLGVNFDTANLIIYGKANPLDAIDLLGPYVRGVHAKDAVYPVNGHDIGKEVRLGDGKANIGAILRKLKDLGYNSHITIEREIAGEQQIEDIKYARDYLEQIITAV